jgi:hypothetical protein
LLLELLGAHRGDRLEVAMKDRDAHPDLLDTQRLVEVPAQALVAVLMR